MATLSDLIVKLSLDSSKFSQGLSGTVQSLSKLQTKFKDSKTGIVDFGKVADSLKSNAQLLTEKFNLQSTRLENLKQKYQEVCKTEGEDSEAAQRLAVQIGALERNMQTLQERIDEVNSDIETNSNRLYQVGTNMQGVGDKMRQLGSKVSDVGKALTTRLTLPLVGIGTAAVKVTADFDSAMSEVAAISGATGDELDQLRDKALEMGSKTKFSASESAEAMKYMAMAGWDTQQMMDGLSGVMNAAAASGEDLGTVSDILTDGLTAFGMAASDSGRMADVLTAAATSSNTTIGLLGETFKYTAPVCGALKISLEDCALATGLMANAGIKGSQAGTTLRTGLTNLINPSSSVKKAMEQYGIALQTNADGSANLSATMQVLRDKLGSLSETERAAALAAIFGSDAVSGWSAVVTASDDDFNSLADAIANSTGKAEEIANLKLDNLSGQLTILKSTVEGIAVQIGDILTPAVSGIVSKIQEFATAFSNLDDGTKKTIVAIAGVAAAIGPVMAILGVVISAIGGIVSAIGGVVAAVGAGSGILAALGTAFTALAGPVAIAVAAVVAISAAIVKFSGQFENVRRIFGAVVTAVGGAFSGILDALKNAFQSIGDTVSNNLIPALQGLSPILSVIKVVLMAVGTVIGSMVAVAFSLLVGAVEAVINVFSGLVTAASGVVQIISGVFGAIVGFITEDTDKCQLAVTNLKDGIVAVFGGLWDAVSGFIQGFVDGVVGFFQDLWDTLVGHSIVPDTIDGIISCFSGLWSGVSGFVSGFVSSVVSAFNSVTTGISTALNAAKQVVTSVFNAIRSVISTVIGVVRSIVSSGFNAVKTAITTPINAAKSEVSRILDAIKNAFSSKLNAAKEVVKSVIDKIKSLFKFNWSLPSLKLPHIQYSLITVPVLGQIPDPRTLHVSWYKNGAVFAKPTIFDTASGVKGVGEAGAEAVLPLSALWSELDVRLASAFARWGNLVDSEVKELLAAIRDAVSSGFADVVSCLKVERTAGGEIVLKLIIDGKELAAVITPYVDENLAHRQTLAGRYV